MLAKGHTVHLKRVKAFNDDASAQDAVRLTKAPDITQYDSVILGAPVRAFSLSPVMKAYLSQLPNIGRKKIACFVTQHFPKRWMGGDQAIRQMTRAIAQKGGAISDTGVVNWTNSARQSQIDALVTRLSEI